MSETPHNPPVEQAGQPQGWGYANEFSFQVPPTVEVPADRPAAELPDWGIANNYIFGKSQAIEPRTATDAPTWIQPGSYLSSVVPPESLPSVQAASWSHEASSSEVSRAHVSPYVGSALVSQAAEVVNVTPEADGPADKEQLKSVQDTYDELRSQIAGMGSKLQEMTDTLYGYKGTIIEAGQLLDNPRAYDPYEAQGIAARLRAFSSRAEEYLDGHNADSNRLVEGAANSSMKVESITQDSLQGMRTAETDPDQAEVAANQEAEADAYSLSKTLVTFASQDVLPSKYHISTAAETLALQIDRAYEGGYALLNDEAVAMAYQSVHQLEQGLSAENDRQTNTLRLLQAAYDSVGRLYRP